MKTGYGFKEFESLGEFKNWIYSQKVTRTITRLQVHHMWMPDYSCWKTDNALRRQNNTKYFHTHTNKWGDIAQHFSIFPNGHIVTGRSLNSTPIGIKGWNTSAICVEIYGNFDKGKDQMTEAQKNAVLGCYKIMATRFNIPIDLAHIRPHGFFTAGGTYLGKYISSKSCKTCPGTGFFGGLDKFESNFLKQVKAFKVDGLSSATPAPSTDYSKYGRYIGDKDDIKAVQTNLKKLGYYKDNIDGSYGPNMYKAVTGFQKAKKLSVDGWVGEKTKAAIKADIKKLSDTPDKGGDNNKPKSIKQTVWDFFIKKGYSKEATAGIMGNMQAESGINPTTIQGNGKGPAAGITQWENYNKKTDRFADMAAHAKSKGKDWTDLESQLEFIDMELSGKAPHDNYTYTLLKRRVGDIEGFKAINDVAKATDVFEACFERAGIRAIEKRTGYANEIYLEMTGGVAQAPNTVKMIKNISNEPLNIRAEADWKAKAVEELKPGCSVTYVSLVTAKNGSTKMYKTKSGTYITASSKYVRLIDVKKS